MLSMTRVVRRKQLALFKTLFLAAFLSSVLLGCGTPMAVKRLSSEQVKAQVSYLASLKVYFEVINKFTDAQVKASDFRIDSLTKDIEQEYKSTAVSQLASAQDDNSRRKILDDLSKNIDNNQATAAQQKQTIAALVAKLKVKQGEMLEAYQNIVSAQQKLDDYIQLKKVDDVVIEQLTGIVGVNRDKIVQSATEIATIGDQVEKILTSTGAPSK